VGGLCRGAQVEGERKCEVPECERGAETKWEYILCMWNDVVYMNLIYVGNFSEFGESLQLSPAFKNRCLFYPST
jgi:hypothetical protein